MLPHKQIELKLQAAVREILPDADVSSVLVRPCPNRKFGDYQTNALMSLARRWQYEPHILLLDIFKTNHFQELLTNVLEPIEAAGPGFLNFRLKNSALAQTLEAA